MLIAPPLAQIEAIVHGRIRTLLAERNGNVGPLSGAEKLSATLGLSSLDLAFLVAELEAELGVDPFAKLIPITSIRSVDDLVDAYRKALAPDPKMAGQDEELAAAMRRGRQRRNAKVRK
jgi:acyl carrier protein